ncbi:MAG: hypothetical protein R2847_02395 [Bacteroidia bacterium]
MIDEKNNTVELTEKGIELITANNEDANFFVMPDVSVITWSNFSIKQRREVGEERSVDARLLQ